MSRPGTAPPAAAATTPSPWDASPTLEGRHVRLEPLGPQHLAGMAAVALDPALWRLTTTRLETADDVRRYIDAAVEERARGVSIPFATVERATGAVIGSTRFGNVSRTDRRVEIGWTWLAPRWQRTGANTEAKLLMLRYAFETLGCLRVELKTDVLNERSRAAILRLGAKEEGIFRKHMVLPSGRVRDTIWFSIVDDEWPAVRTRLEAKLR